MVNVDTVNALAPTEFTEMDDVVIAELVVNVDTVNALAPKELIFMELTEIAFVHVSALLAPDVST